MESNSVRVQKVELNDGENIELLLLIVNTWEQICIQ